MKIIHYICASIICISPLLAQNGWNYINPNPQNNPLYGLQCISDTEVFAVGEAGMRMYTTDGGASWTQEPIGHPQLTTPPRGAQRYHSALLSIHFPNPPVGTTSVGYAVGQIRDNLNDFHERSPGKFVYGMYKTEDGGDTWLEQEIPLPREINYVRSVYFRTNTTGFAVGDNGLLIRTTDGGTNWDTLHIYKSSLYDRNNRITPEPALIAGGKSILYCIKFFPGSNTGFIVGQSSDQTDDPASSSNTVIVFRTTDGGDSWRRVNLGFSCPTLKGLDVFPGSPGSRVVVAVGDGGVIIRSTDDGATWANATVPNTYGRGYTAVSVADANCASAVGEYGIISRTTNAGANWTAELRSLTKDGFKLLNIAYAPNNANVGYAIGYYGLILKTTDKGITWYNIGVSSPSVTTNYLNDVHYRSDSRMLAVGDRGIIIRGTKASNAWSLQSIQSPTHNNLHGVFFLNDDVAMAVGDNGTIISSVDGGVRWSNVYNSGTEYNLRSVHLRGTTTSFVATVVGENGVILHSSNSGVSWSKISVSGYNHRGVYLYDVDFASSSQVGLAVGSNRASNTSETLPLILKTTDDGLTWSDAPSTNLNNLTIDYREMQLRSVSFRSGSTDVAVAGIMYAGSAGPVMNVVPGGLIAVSGDEGDTWTQKFFRNFLYAVDFNNDGEVYLAGDEGMIINQNPNLGNNWMLLHSATKGPIRGISFRDGNGDNAVAVGFRGTMLSTGNGGAFPKNVAYDETSQEEIHPTSYLKPNHPNPFSQSTEIDFTISEAGHVVLEIRDELGNSVATLLDKYMQPGHYSTVFEPGQLASGVYFYQLKTDTNIETRSMLIIR